jgi:hypothetical protein
MLRRFALAIALGMTGGLAFWWLDWPLAWLLGPMLATTLAAIGGLPVIVPTSTREPMLAILGVLLGSGFTPDLLAQLGEWLPTLLSLPAYVGLVTLASVTYLRRVARYDPRTALFAGTPGGFGEMVLLGDKAGADARRIALIHSVRVLLIVLFVPLVVRALGIELPASPKVEPPAGWVDIVALLAAAALGAGLGRLLHLPAPALLGGMLVSALGHATGLIHGAPPAVVVGLAQLVIGCSIGCRFAGFRLHDVLATLTVGFGLTIVMFVMSFAAAAAVHLATDAPPLLLLLALVPGGVAEMSVIALALGIDPAFVATHHIVRIALVVAAAPLVFRWLARQKKDAGPKAGV